MNICNISITDCVKIIYKNKLVHWRDETLRYNLLCCKFHETNLRRRYFVRTRVLLSFKDLSDDRVTRY